MSVFKPTLTPQLLKCLKGSLVGKHIEKNTDLKVKNILKNCFLEIPEEHIFGVSWLMIWDPDILAIKPEYFYSTQILLKQAWFKDIGQNLKKFVEQMLNQLRKNVLKVT